eukprot:gb/GECG01010957.1/.p1 GENE.gb/GECG01010957.1/~~gb/GECG01010957.1/.p1  ORF type:complete len:1106 (+),score=151.79 gb/GECG01010957.1/:1-3318(+)
MTTNGMGASPTLEEALRLSLEPNNASRIQAEQAVKQWMKDSNASFTLVQIIQSSPHESARHLAALLLRRKVNSIWKRLDEAHQRELKQIVINRMTEEPSRGVRRGLVGVACSLAKHQIPSNNWPELWQFLGTCTQHTNSEAREMGFFLLSELGLTILDSLVDQYESILPVFVNGMQDSDSSVRTLALRGFSIFAAGLLQSEAIDKLADTIPVVMSCLDDCLGQGEEQVAVDALDTLSELVIIDVKLVERHLQRICKTLTDCISSDEIMPPPKVSASEVLKTLIEQYPKKLAKSGYITQLIPLLMSIAAKNSTDPNLEAELPGEYLGGIHHGNTKPADEDEDEEDENVKIVSLCGRLIDTIALNCSPKKVWNCVSATCSACLGSQDWRQRKAALMALAMVAEGCRESLLEHLEQPLQYICHGTQDSIPAVREASFWALGQFAEQLMPHIAYHHETMLPPLLYGVRDGSQRVAERAMFALEAYSENLEQDVICKHMRQILQTLYAALNTPKASSMQAYAISALASVAIAAKEDFQPYFHHVLPRIIEYIQDTDEANSSLRAKAIDCLGHVCAAVGKEYFDTIKNQGYDILALVSQASSAEDLEVQESVFSFFGQIASVLKADFAPVMHKLFDSLAETANSSDGIETSSRFMRENDDDFTNKFLDRDDDDDLDDGNHVLTSFHAHSDVLDLKETAVATLGMCAHHLGAAFQPWAEKTYNMLMENHLSHHHEPIRQHAVTSLQYVIESIYYNECTETLSDGFKQLRDNTLTEFVMILKSEEDLEVCGRVCDALRFLCTISNGVIVESHVKAIMEQLRTMLDGEAMCQQDADDEDSEDEEGGQKSQAQVLIDSVIELIAGLAKTFGRYLDEMFATLFPSLVEYTKRKNSALDRAMVIGLFAEVLGYFGGDVFANRYQSALQIIMDGLSDESPLVTRNSLFGIGQTAQECPQVAKDLIPKYLPIIAGFTDPEKISDRAVLENAAGAIGRFIHKFWDSGLVDVSHYLPCLLRVLPVEDDFQENETIYSTLLLILEKQPALVDPYADKFVAVLHHDLSRDNKKESLSIETKRRFAHLLQSGNLPSLVKAIQNLPAAEQKELAAQLQANAAEVR